MSRSYAAVKRGMDIVGASIALAVLSPLMLVVAAAIILDDGRPVLYRGRRTGRFGQPFTMYKFRTMVVQAEALGGPSTALDDPRLTSCGALLRKYKVDELPQLVNVLLGEMSLVGPRPQVKRYTDLYSSEEMAILDVRPGLTDFASIEFIHLDHLLGRDDVDDRYQREVEPRKNQLRLKYVREQSIGTDLIIILRTISRMTSIPKLWNSGR